MIKNTELRVGNLVFDDSKRKTLRKIVWNDLGFEDVPFDPVPLTPELLNKTNFEKWSDINTYSIESNNGTIQIHFGVKIEAFLGGNDSVTSGQCYVLHLEYLHELQNLCLDLTGKHLIFIQQN